MENFDTIYALLIPLILIAYGCVKPAFKWYISNSIGVFNILMLLNSINLIRVSWVLYRFTVAFSNATEKEPFNNMALLNLLVHQPKFWLTICIMLIPLLFLIKKLSSNVVVTLVFLIALFVNGKAEQIVDFFQSGSGPFKHILQLFADNIYTLLNFFSCFVSLYALLWMLHRLPHQLKPKHASSN